MTRRLSRFHAAHGQRQQSGQYIGAAVQGQKKTLPAAPPQADQLARHRAGAQGRAEGRDIWTGPARKRLMMIGTQKGFIQHIVFDEQLHHTQSDAIRTRRRRAPFTSKQDKVPVSLYSNNVSSVEGTRAPANSGLNFPPASSRLNFFPRRCTDTPAAGGRPIEGRVVHHDQFSIARDIDVALDHFHAQLNGFAIRLQCVLRIRNGMPAVGDRQGAILPKPGVC